MKKILVILAVALVALSSCKKEDDVSTSKCGEVISTNYTNSYGEYLVYYQIYGESQKSSVFLKDNGNKLSAGDEYCE